MTITTRPADKFPLDNTGRLKLEWDAFFQAVSIFPQAYQVAGLPTSATAGSMVYVSDGRKPGEAGGGGTGVLAYWDSTNAWISVHSGVAVTA